MKEAMNIFQKMSAISAEIDANGGVVKTLPVTTGSNPYKAVSETSILEVVSPLEHKYGIYSYPVSATRTSDMQEKVVQDSNGYPKPYVFVVERVDLIYRFVNGDKPDEYIDIAGFGTGVDTVARCNTTPGKAMTSAVKYALMKAYKIRTFESEGETGAFPNPQQSYQPAPQYGNTPSNPYPYVNLAPPAGTEQVNYPTYPAYQNGGVQPQPQPPATQPATPTRRRGRPAKNASATPAHPVEVATPPVTSAQPTPPPPVSAPATNNSSPMSVEEARGIVLDVGLHSGKSLGYLADNDRDALEYYAANANSRHPEYQTAATLLLNQQ